MNEQQVRALVDRWAAGVGQHRDAAKRCTYFRERLTGGPGRSIEGVAS